MSDATQKTLLFVVAKPLITSFSSSATRINVIDILGKLSLLSMIFEK